MYRFHSSMVECPHSIRGGPGSIPGRCSSTFGIWREVLGCNVYRYITSQYFFPAIIYRDIISHITSTYRYIMYFFRPFKKSTAPYKVHNMGLRYIKETMHAIQKEVQEGCVWKLKSLIVWKSLLTEIKRSTVPIYKDHLLYRGTRKQKNYADSCGSGSTTLVTWV